MHTRKDVAALRQEYRLKALREDEVAADPLAQFTRWFDEALAALVPEPNAMTLATVAPDGRPAARIVLLKGFDAGGFDFYTNTESRKGRELAATPYAALVFWWPLLERQVRIEGAVVPVPEALADAYFQTRPRESQLGAWASPQSQPLDDRAVLEQRLADVTARYEGQAVPRPPRWGGYRVVPTCIEFWQGRPGRLHDRLCFQRQDDGSWSLERLAP
jgi:pyridoxamine 5'-phosphate oxidase